MDDDRFKRWNNTVSLAATGFGLVASVQKTRLVLTLVSSLPVAKDREDQKIFLTNVQELVKEMMPTDNSPDDDAR